MSGDNMVAPLARAARRLGVPARWLRAEADAGRVPCLRAGARYLFDIDAVGTILAERATPDTLKPAALVTTIVAARRAGKRDLEAGAQRELEQRFGVSLRFATDLETGVAHES